jgi:hypothetical protein
MAHFLNARNSHRDISSLGSIPHLARVTIAATILGIALSACVVYPDSGYGYAGVDIAVAPPPPPEVMVPPPRVGFVWAPGFWGWNGQQHVWHEGRWMHERPGHHWQADHWEQHGNRWHYAQGHWEPSHHG